MIRYRLLVKTFVNCKTFFKEPMHSYRSYQLFQYYICTKEKKSVLLLLLGSVSKMNVQENLCVCNFTGRLKKMKKVNECLSKYLIKLNEILLLVHDKKNKV